jgi:predicted nucleic acid-binding protein
MTRSVFADAAYWVARIDHRDQWHAKARRLTKQRSGTPIVTTQEIPTEVLNHFSAFGILMRQKAIGAVDAIIADTLVTVLPQTDTSFQRGYDLYRARPDKEYSLTDCVAMHVMHQEGITEILTGDNHFTQEGFTTLF